MQIPSFFSGRPWVAPLALLAAVEAIYSESWLSLGHRWNTRGEAYSHAFLLLLIAFGLGFKRFNQFLLAPKEHSWLAVLFLAGISLFWLAGELTQVNIIQQLTLPAIPFIVLWAVAGFSAAQRLLFPFAIIYTVIPFWDFLIPSMQNLTVAISTGLLTVLHIPVFVTGHLIQLPSGTLQVAEGCAGLSYLLISLTLAAIYAFSGNFKWTHWIAILSLGVILGLATNWIRVFGLAVIAYASEMQSPIVKDHELFGWAIFATCLIPFFLIARLLENHGSKAHASDESNSANKANLTAPPLLLGAVAVASTMGPVLAMWIEGQRPTSIAITLPGTLLGATERQPANIPSYGWSPEYQNPDLIRSNSYQVGNQVADVLVLTYLQQRQGKELVNWGNHLFNEAVWILDKQFDHDGLVLTTISNKSHTAGYRIYSWYNIGGSNTTRDEMAKLLQLKGTLLQRSDASLVAVASRCMNMPCAPDNLEFVEWVNNLRNNTAQIIREKQ